MPPTGADYGADARRRSQPAQRKAAAAERRSRSRSLRLRSRSRSRGEEINKFKSGGWSKSKSKAREDDVREDLYMMGDVQFFAALHKGRVDRPAFGEDRPQQSSPPRCSNPDYRSRERDIEYDTSRLQIRARAGGQAETQVGELPASVGHGMFYVATWHIGKRCTAQDLADNLAAQCPAVVVLVMSNQMGEDHEVMQLLTRCNRKDVSHNHRDDPEQQCWRRDDFLVKQVCGNTAVRALGLFAEPPDDEPLATMWVAFHKAKVASATHTEAWSRSRGPNERYRLGKLTVHLIERRQRMQTVNIGLLDCRTKHPRRADASAAAAFCLLERVDMLTGFFGSADATRFKEHIETIGTKAYAIFNQPFAQHIKMQESAAAATDIFSPTFYMMFGYYRVIKVPLHAPRNDEAIDLGADIIQECYPVEDVLPSWPDNDVGNAYCQNLGQIKMKKADFSRWFNGCYQTIAIIGTSVPSYSSQARQERIREENRQKGKGKTGQAAAAGKGKGRKGKGKGKEQKGKQGKGGGKQGGQGCSGWLQRLRIRQ